MNRRLTNRMIAGLLLIAAPAGVLTACGGSDDASDATSAPAAEGATDDAVTVPEITVADDTETDSTDDFSDLTVPPGATGECADIAQEVVDALQQAGSDENFAGLQAAIGSLRDVVPDDLKDDVDVLTDAYGQLADLVAQNGGDVEAALADPDLQAQFEAIGTEEVTNASDALDAYFSEVCPELNGS